MGPKKLVIDLNGPDGNALALISYARVFSRQLGLEYHPIEKEMTSGDYQNLIKVFESHFGDFVQLIHEA